MGLYKWLNLVATMHYDEFENVQLLRKRIKKFQDAFEDSKMLMEKSEHMAWKQRYWRDMIFYNKQRKYYQELIKGSY